MPADKKVLIVEDSETQALALAYMLEQEGLQVQVASNSEEAFLALKESVFDAAIIDYHLPGLRGDELCRRIRQNVGTRSLPLIILTSENTAEVNSIDSGADVYVAKPVDADILRMRLFALF